MVTSLKLLEFNKNKPLFVNKDISIINAMSF